ncbi:hypothetical protein PR048_015139 [Dryococelus australis]|uniref:DUF4817 domain-containing protein n=1 Tax=Dryococelus australis TaxID=614101 RepID=A0ABQ9HGL6_9NEOP|nr:hypothetical protein PR048_015139 [Dryococelus australis]
MQLVYGVAEENVRKVQIMYRNLFSHGQQPHHTTFETVEQRCRRSVGTDRFEEDVLRHVENTPNSWFLEQRRTYPDFDQYILFADEESFQRDGIQNCRNIHECADVNLHTPFVYGVQQRSSSNSWAGVIHNMLVGSYLLPHHHTSNVYAVFLQETLPTLLDEIALQTRVSMWFQHDGALGHSLRCAPVNEIAVESEEDLVARIVATVRIIRNNEFPTQKHPHGRCNRRRKTGTENARNPEKRGNPGNTGKHRENVDPHTKEKRRPRAILLFCRSRSVCIQGREARRFTIKRFQCHCQISLKSTGDVYKKQVCKRNYSSTTVLSHISVATGLPPGHWLALQSPLPDVDSTQLKALLMEHRPENAARQKKGTSLQPGAIVAEWLACSPPNKAIQVQSPARSLRILKCGNRAGQCSLSAAIFLGVTHFPLPFVLATLHTQSSSSALKTSMLRAAEISPLYTLHPLKAIQNIRDAMKLNFFAVTIAMYQFTDLETEKCSANIEASPAVTNFYKNCGQQKLWLCCLEETVTAIPMFIISIYVKRNSQNTRQQPISAESGLLPAGNEMELAALLREGVKASRFANAVLGVLRAVQVNSCSYQHTAWPVVASPRSGTCAWTEREDCCFVAPLSYVGSTMFLCTRGPEFQVKQRNPAMRRTSVNLQSMATVIQMTAVAPVSGPPIASSPERNTSCLLALSRKKKKKKEGEELTPAEGATDRQIDIWCACLSGHIPQEKIKGAKNCVAGERKKEIGGGQSEMKREPRRKENQRETRTGLNPRPDHTRIFSTGNRSERCCWLAGFLGNLLFPPPLHSGDAPFSPHFTLIALLIIHFTFVYQLVDGEIILYQQCLDFRDDDHRKSRLPEKHNSGSTLSAFPSTLCALVYPHVPNTAKLVATPALFVVVSLASDLAAERRAERCSLASPADEHSSSTAVWNFSLSETTLDFFKTLERPNRGSARGDRYIRISINSLIASTRKALNRRAVSPQITRLSTRLSAETLPFYDEIINIKRCDAWRRASANHSVENVARATNIGVDARHQRPGNKKNNIPDDRWQHGLCRQWLASNHRSIVKTQITLAAGGERWTRRCIVETALGTSRTSARAARLVPDATSRRTKESPTAKQTPPPPPPPPGPNETYSHRTRRSSAASPAVGWRGAPTCVAPALPPPLSTTTLDAAKLNRAPRSGKHGENFMRRADTPSHRRVLHRRGTGKTFCLPPVGLSTVVPLDIHAISGRFGKHADATKTELIV